MASSISNKKTDDLCNWEFINQSDVVDDDADLLIYAEVQSLDSVSIFSSDDESEDIKSVDLTSGVRDVLYDDVVMAGSSPNADLKFTMPPSATAVDDDDDLDEEEDSQESDDDQEEEDSQYSDDDQEEEEENSQYSDDDHEVEGDDEDLAGKLYLKLQEIRHAQAVHAGLAPHDNQQHDVAVNFPASSDFIENQIHQDVHHVSLSNGYDYHHDDSETETDDSNGQDKRRGIVFHIRLPPNYRYNLDLNSEPMSTDYDDASDEDDDEYDLDDELVPREVAGKFERQRMRKLGKRPCSKITRSKRLVLQYSKPGCLRGKHGLGLKANC